MPKLKSHSGAKKRCKLTASGKIKITQTGKKHGMIKRLKRTLRNQKGYTFDALTNNFSKVVKKFLLFKKKK
ncbi:MAG: 50S ribosomal protein L35 [Anaplasmataceae bacterium]|nr:50S ribosomal protein L35 [Anaplasmataceae bacterium]